MSSPARLLPHPTSRPPRPWLGLVLALALAPLQACGGAAPDTVDQTTLIYLTLDTRQCEPGGRSIAEVQQRAQATGLSVLSAACGLDGAMYAAVCGAPDGRIAILEIPAAQLGIARTAGFKPLTELPEARRVPCA